MTMRSRSIAERKAARRAYNAKLEVKPVRKAYKVKCNANLEKKAARKAHMAKYDAKLERKAARKEKRPQEVKGEEHQH